MTFDLRGDTFWSPTGTLCLKTKGYDPLRDVKSQAAWRWVRAVNADGSFGGWSYAMVSDMDKMEEAVGRAAASGNSVRDGYE